MDNTRESTYGHLQQHRMKLEMIMMSVPALRPLPHTLELSLLSLVRITSVRLAVDMVLQTGYSQLIHSGMGVVVVSVALAANTLLTPGSARPSLSQLLMI